ncbi:hypothetical protein JHK85_004829 [Glycine max]|nr:hypothetical protein JHK85_004829 [Glycine max]
MSSSAKVLDPAFQGVGQRDEAGTAAIKTVELDAAIGGRAVQHREIQGHESDKFLSYFKPCIIPLEGGVASGFKKPEEEKFETCLYVCRGKRVVRLRQVPFARSSLNHEDVFILDTQNKIYQFNGANSNIQERAKALEVIQFLKEKYHEGKCDVAIVDDGKLDTESDSGEFWVLFGGFAPIGKKVISEDDIIPETIPAQLYSIVDGEVKPVEGELSKSLLENNKCYLLDCGAEMFVWVGRVTQVEERKAACQAVEDLLVPMLRKEEEKLQLAILTNGLFDVLSALLKQQGMGVKGMTKSTPVNEEIPPLLEGDGKIEVWRINGNAKTALPKEEIGKFYSGDCYIVLYTYHSGERKEDYFVCCWFGKDSVEEDQTTATRLANTMSTSLKGRPVQGRIFEGKEPPQFVAIFQPMVVLKGGLSSGYKKLMADKGASDETYTAESIALIRISGTSIHNNKSVQVDAVPSSLNSTECFVLQSGSTIFTWHGNQCSFEQQQLAAKVADFLRCIRGFFMLAVEAVGDADPITIVEHLGTGRLAIPMLIVEEVYNFSQDDLLPEDILILDTHVEVFIWIGHSVDPKEKQNAFDIGQKYIDLAASLEGLSPHVPLYKVTEGNEPCFFTTYFSWDHAKAMVLGNSFQKKVSLLFGFGHAVEEKSNGSSLGGPRQRAEALAALSNAFSSSSEKASSLAQDRLNGLGQGGPRQRAEALAALNSAFSSSSGTKTFTPRPSGRGQGSQRAAAVAALSQVLTAEKKKSPDGSPVASRSPITQGSATETKSDSSEVEEVAEAKETEELPPETGSNGDLEPKQENVEEGNDGQRTFSYEQLKTKSGRNVPGIDLKRREFEKARGEYPTHAFRHQHKRNKHQAPGNSPEYATISIHSCMVVL